MGSALRFKAYFELTGAERPFGATYICWANPLRWFRPAVEAGPHCGHLFQIIV